MEAGDSDDCSLTVRDGSGSLVYGDSGDGSLIAGGVVDDWRQECSILSRRYTRDNHLNCSHGANQIKNIKVGVNLYSNGKSKEVYCMFLYNLTENMSNMFV